MEAPVSSFAARINSETVRVRACWTSSRGGRVDFDDQVEGEKHALTELNVGVPFISSLPAHAEIKVLPEIAANVNGARLSLAGDTLPFDESRATRLKLTAEGIEDKGGPTRADFGLK